MLVFPCQEATMWWVVRENWSKSMVSLRPFYSLRFPRLRWIAKQLRPPVKKKTLQGDSVIKLDLLADWPDNYFPGQSAGRNSNTSAGALVLLPENITSSDPFFTDFMIFSVECECYLNRKKNIPIKTNLWSWRPKTRETWETCGTCEAYSRPATSRLVDSNTRWFE